MSRRGWCALPSGLALTLLLSACGGGGADSLAAQSRTGGPPAETGVETGTESTARAGQAARSAAGSTARPGRQPGGAESPAAPPTSGTAPAAKPVTAKRGTTADGGAGARSRLPSAAGPAKGAGRADGPPAPGGSTSTSTSTSTSDGKAGAGGAQEFTGAEAASARLAAVDKRAYDASGGATDRGVTKETIRLGSVNMHSMAAGNLITAPQVRGNLATITALNDRGGILGRRLTLVDCDSGTGDTARGKACVKKLVERDKVFALITGVDWSTASIHDELRRYNLPYVGAWAYSQTEWQDPYMFPTHMSMIHEAMAGGQWVKNVIKPRTYGLLCLTSPEMQLACDEVQRQLDPAGAELVHRADVAISENTMSPFVIAMRARNPDHIIHYVINPLTVAKFFLEAEQQNYWPSMGMSGNHLASEVLGSVWGRFAAGRYWTNTTYRLWGAEFMATMSRYARGNKGANHHIVQAGYVGINLLAQAAKNVGPNLTRERLMAELGNGQVWKSDASMDQKFSYRPSERLGKEWSTELGNGREFMYKYTGPNTVANPDGSPSGFIPDPGQFVIYTH